MGLRALDGLLGDLGEVVEAWGPRRGWELESWIEPSRRKFVKEGVESRGRWGRVGSVPRKVCVSFGFGVRLCQLLNPREKRGNGLPFRGLRGACTAGRPGLGVGVWQGWEWWCISPN